MAKFTYTPLASLTNESAAIALINANFAALQGLIDNLLSRDGESPNTMTQTLDMNSQRVVNLPAPNNNSEPVRLVDLTNSLAAIVASVVDIAGLPTAEPSGPGVLWNNGGFLCIGNAPLSPIGNGSQLTGITITQVSGVSPNSLVGNPTDASDSSQDISVGDGLKIQ